MNQTAPTEIIHLKLNGQNVPRLYSAYVRNTIETNGKTVHSCVAMNFSIQLARVNAEGNLEYRLTVGHRVFLDEKGRHVLKPSKAQKLALMVAKLNDNLLLEVSKHSRLLRVVNTEDIRAEWKGIKSRLIGSYADLGDIVADFDWQLQEENIQKIFLLDNFYQFVFSNLFYRDFKEDSFLKDNKTIANGLGHLDIPIIEKKCIAQRDGLSRNMIITSRAEMDVNNARFPQEKMEVFLGNLIPSEGSEHELDFNYEGAYEIKPNIGLLTKGQLDYQFEIKNIYKKTTTIHFKLENDER